MRAAVPSHASQVITSLPIIAPYFVGFLTAFGLSVGLTYGVREGARHLGLFDPVDERKLPVKPPASPGAPAE